MKKIYVITTSWCPHCKRAKEMMQTLLNEHEEWTSIPIEIIDEEKEPQKLMPYFKYYYVPTIYVGEDKILEGVPTKEALIKAFETAKK